MQWHRPALHGVLRHPLQSAGQLDHLADDLAGQGVEVLRHPYAWKQQTGMAWVRPRGVLVLIKVKTGRNSPNPGIDCRRGCRV
jgi:hypothetical protein